MTYCWKKEVTNKMDKTNAATPHSPYVYIKRSLEGVTVNIYGSNYLENKFGIT